MKEETNLDIFNLEVFGAVDDIQPDRHFVTIHVLAREVVGELQVNEPDKQDEWKWFSLQELPDKIYSPSKKFIDAFLQAQAE